MRRAINFLLCTVFIACLATGAAANTLERIFTQANVVDERTEQDIHYLLPLGRVKDDRKAGRALPSHYERLEGNLAVVTWKLEGALSLGDARQLMLTFLERQKADLMFECAGRDCGESSLWANGIFAQPLLFGSDRAQYLWVLRSREAPRYHVLYLVERPNRRLYFHEETLTVPAGELSADGAQSALKNRGRVVVGRVGLLDNKADFGEVVARVSQWKAGISFPPVLVIHRHGETTALTGLTQQLTDALTAAGITAQVEDVGALAPDIDAPGMIWVEWVNTAWYPGMD
ncbi:MAG TPA: DUF4892 domain-containing protein [Dongiaceae bacterium]|nr:DUF4892 domain-containing protein [Dongiaceae bacterium]